MCSWAWADALGAVREISVHAGLRVGRAAESEVTHLDHSCFQVLGIPGPKVMSLWGQSRLLTKTPSPREGWPKTSRSGTDTVTCKPACLGP